MNAITLTGGVEECKDEADEHQAETSKEPPHIRGGVYGAV